MNYDDTSKLYKLEGKENIYVINSEDIINPVGKGAFGQIFKGKGPNNEIVAIKQISKSSLPIEKINAELDIMKNAKNYSNSANLIYAIDSVQDNNFIYIIMPYCNEGTLTSFIEQKNIKTEFDAIEYFRQICYGMSILHENGIIHRDLKTDNILLSPSLDSSYPLKHYMLVADYGLSKISFNETQHTIGVGTYYTNAPEVDSGKYDTKADVFSLGCIYYKMLYGKEPFSGSTIEELQKSKKSIPRLLKLQNGSFISKISAEILNGCLKYNPTERMSPDQLYTLLNIKNLYSNYTVMDISEKFKGYAIQASSMVNISSTKKYTQISGFNNKELKNKLTLKKIGGDLEISKISYSKVLIESLAITNELKMLISQQPQATKPKHNFPLLKSYWINWKLHYSVKVPTSLDEIKVFLMLAYSTVRKNIESPSVVSQNEVKVFLNQSNDPQNLANFVNKLQNATFRTQMLFKWRGKNTGNGFYYLINAVIYNWLSKNEMGYLLNNGSIALKPNADVNIMKLIAISLKCLNNQDENILDYVQKAYIEWDKCNGEYCSGLIKDSHLYYYHGDIEILNVQMSDIAIII